MVWTPIVNVEPGALVSTPEGTGRVRRFSEVNDTAQVEIDGKLFEVPRTDLSNLPEPEQPSGELKVGDEIQKVDKPSSKGKVVEVTQRTIRVKWKANGKEAAFQKKAVERGKHIERSSDQPSTQPSEQPTEQPSEQPEEQTPEQQEEEKQARDVADDLYGLLKLKQKLEQKIDEDVSEELKALREAIKAKQQLEIKIGDTTNVIEGLKHKQLEQLITYSALRLSPLLVGMAGTGKTHAGQQTAEALGLQFYSISVGAQTTKTDIMGYMDATGNYNRSLFREAYEHGGVFLMDEIDAGNSNVLITINAALANGLAAFPDGMVKRHEDFVFIASANTFGNGANRQYVGRNQLDAATLDRFAVIEWLIDDELESNLTSGINGKAWYMAVRAARDYVAEHNIRALVTPRATQKGCQLLGAGCAIEEVIGATILGSVPEDKKSDVTKVATDIFEKFASEVPSELPTEVNPPTAVDLIKDEMPF